MESSHRWTFVGYISTQQVPIGLPGQTHTRTRVTLNAPPPFFEWRGHKKNVCRRMLGVWTDGETNRFKTASCDNVNLKIEKKTH